MDPEVTIKAVGAELHGKLKIPETANGLVIFSNSKGESYLNPKNTYIAEKLNEAGLATMLTDLVTKKEAEAYRSRFDIELLTDRLVGLTKWCFDNPSTEGMELAYFGQGTGTAAALSAAAYWGVKIKAVVSRSGRPDLTGDELDLVESPTLLIVGGEDKDGINVNRQAYSHMGCEKKVELVAEAGRLFDEPGAMDRMVELAINWFKAHFD